MADTTLFQMKVPTPLLKRVKIAAYRERYEFDEQTAPVYKMLYDHPDVPLEDLRKRLRNEFGIHRRISGLKRIAEECGLKYTE